MLLRRKHDCSICKSPVFYNTDTKCRFCHHTTFEIDIIEMGSSYDPYM